MVVDDFDIERALVFPAEADPPSFIDSDAMLTSPVPLQSFQTVAGWRG
jgi:hypothetical protein